MIGLALAHTSKLAGSLLRARKRPGIEQLFGGISSIRFAPSPLSHLAVLSGAISNWHQKFELGSIRYGDVATGLIWWSLTATCNHAGSLPQRRR